MKNDYLECKEFADFRNADQAVKDSHEQYEKTLQKLQRVCPHDKVHEKVKKRRDEYVVRICNSCGLEERAGKGRPFNVLTTDFIKIVKESVIQTIRACWSAPR